MKIGAHLFELYLHQISTKLDEFWCTCKQNTVPNPYLCTHGFGMVFCLHVHQNSSKFGGDIAQISAHQFLLSSINFVINSTPQGLWEQKGQKTCVTPYQWRLSESDPAWAANGVMWDGT